MQTTPLQRTHRRIDRSRPIQIIFSMAPTLLDGAHAIDEFLDVSVPSIHNRYLLGYSELRILSNGKWRMGAK